MRTIFIFIWFSMPLMSKAQGVFERILEQLIEKNKSYIAQYNHNQLNFILDIPCQAENLPTQVQGIHIQYFTRQSWKMYVNTKSQPVFGILMDYMRLDSNQLVLGYKKFVAEDKYMVGYAVKSSLLTELDTEQKTKKSNYTSYIYLPLPNNARAVYFKQLQTLPEHQTYFMYKRFDVVVPFDTAFTHLRYTHWCAWANVRKQWNRRVMRFRPHSKKLFIEQYRPENSCAIAVLWLDKLIFEQEHIALQFRVGRYRSAEQRKTALVETQTLILECKK